MSTQDFDERFAAAVTEIEQRNAQTNLATSQRKGLWLSHHWPDQFDRCIVVGKHHVCRRCAVFYPLTIVLVALSFFDVVPWPADLDAVVIWSLSIIGTGDFVAEQLGIRSYDPRRQVFATAVVGVAFGRAAGIELQDRWSTEFWLPLIVFGAVWLAVAMVGNRRRTLSEL